MAYESLGRLRDLQSPESIAELRAALGGVSLLAARAAEIAADNGLRELIPDMIAAFERFMVDGEKVDKQCNAKSAIATALNGLEYMGGEVFLAGARHIQMEPVLGGRVDTAINLRCTCASGLARIEHPDTYYVLTELLADAERAVRIAAVKALTYLGSPESELLIRLRVLTGDKEFEVIEECFAGLMTMAPDRSLGFISRFLMSGDPAIVESAALAIGNSRITSAYDVLRQSWEDDPSPSVRRMLLLPIALVRSREAFDFLLQVLRAADPKTAQTALSALSLYVDDESVRAIEEVIAARGDLRESTFP